MKTSPTKYNKNTNREDTANSERQESVEKRQKAG